MNQSPDSFFYFLPLALKTVGYAVQPSGNAVLAGLGTMLVAGVLHFYISRRGDGGGGGDAGPSGDGIVRSPSHDGNHDITIISHQPQLPV